MYRPKIYNSDHQKWDTIFQQHGVHTLDYSRDPWIVESLPKLGLPDGFFLDAGCGFGRHLLYATSLGWHVIGVDASVTALTTLKNSLNMSNKLKEKCSFICADLNEKFLWREYCRAGICTDVLSIIRSPQKVLNNLHSSVQKNAFFLVTFQSTEDQTYGEGKMKEECLGEWKIYTQNNINYRFYTANGIYSLINSTSWKLIDMVKFERLDPPHAHRPYEHCHSLFGCILQAQ